MIFDSMAFMKERSKMQFTQDQIFIPDLYCHCRLNHCLSITLYDFIVGQSLLFKHPWNHHLQYQMIY